MCVQQKNFRDSLTHYFGKSTKFLATMDHNMIGERVNYHETKEKMSVKMPFWNGYSR